MNIPPLYFCPDCEGHKVFMYAGKIIPKLCSGCRDRRHNALTGSDRINPGIDPKIRTLFKDVDKSTLRVFRS